jgi:hypothetical protein
VAASAGCGGRVAWCYVCTSSAAWSSQSSSMTSLSGSIGNAKPLFPWHPLRSPYQGKLGVVEEGALADLLLVDDDPFANIKLIEDPAKHLVVIMKDGKIYKNLLSRPTVP